MFKLDIMNNINTNAAFKCQNCINCLHTCPRTNGTRLLNKLGMIFSSPASTEDSDQPEHQRNHADLSLHWG